MTQILKNTLTLKQPLPIVQFVLEIVTSDEYKFLYQIWHEDVFLGEFYEESEDKWVAKPHETDSCYIFNTPSLALFEILALKLQD